MRVSSKLLVLAAVVTPLAAVSSSLGGAVGPQPATPNPTGNIKGHTLRFTLKAGAAGNEAPGKQNIFLTVVGGSGPLVDANKNPITGTLPGNQSFIREMKWKPSDNRYVYVLSATDYDAASTFWANTPGHYRWAPFEVDCAKFPDAIARLKHCAFMSSHVNPITISAQ